MNNNNNDNNNDKSKKIDVNDMHCGFVAVLGAPNAGKSTLVNHFLGTKVSIVSHKVQTTRTIVRGIAINGNAQIVFIDTPGIFKPKKRLEKAMVSAAWTGASDADMVMLLVDAKKGLDEETQNIIANLKKYYESKPKLLVINKIDTIKRDKLLALTAALNDTGIFDETYMISALNGDGTQDLYQSITDHTPKGMWMFPEDQISDMPQRLLAAEITREKVFLKLHDEIPYSIAIDTEQWTENEDGSIRIDQTIYVERETQKQIVLGKSGRKIKSIGSEARLELEEIFECKIHLFLFVKVREKWANDPSQYRQWGLDFNA
ncbi:MAG: GTPase Era [Alphaproteobacteria bacterium]|nr:GTPase Era [Alphaproteobacteria bacterium]